MSVLTKTNQAKKIPPNNKKNNLITFIINDDVVAIRNWGYNELINTFVPNEFEKILNIYANT